jgi:prolyl 4-hydroxylase
MKGYRVWSVQITLNDITDGGYLTFPSIGRNIKPIKGDGVIWKNIYDNGLPNPHTKHTYLKTNEADKYVLFKYFRQNSILNAVIDRGENKEIEISLDEIN